MCCSVRTVTSAAGSSASCPWTRCSTDCGRRPEPRVADRLARALGHGGTVRALAAVTTELVEEARRRHDTAPTATAALGRALTGALLLAGTIKRDERLSLEFSGDGPLRGVLVDATPDGDARGFVLRPATHVPPRAGKLDVGGGLWRGGTWGWRAPIAAGLRR